MAKQELMKEGVDPVSGNEKPVGAMPEEVRDDVDAKLSVGEFVLPADVVRYIGLSNIMKLRDAAKAGLARMEDQGQMGNGDEQVVEGHNVDIEEMIEGMGKGEDETEMAFAAGGVVPSSQYAPVMQYNAPSAPTVAGVAQPIQAGSAQYIRPTIAGTSAMRSSQYTPVFVPAQQSPTGAPTTTPAVTGALPQGGAPEGYTPPNYTEYVVPTEAIPGEITEKIYVGPNGERVTIRFKGSSPIDPIPVGYVPESQINPEVETPEVEAPKIDTPAVDRTKVVDGGGVNNSGGSSSDGDGVPQQEAKKTSTMFALAEIASKNDPELAEKLAKYKDEYADLDFSRMSAGEVFKEALSRFGIIGVIRTVADAIQIGMAKSDVMDAVAEFNVGIPANLLMDWNESDRDSIELMQTASMAQQLGASDNLALAIAIDDRFDAEVLSSFGEDSDQVLSTWEQTIADTYNLDSGSYQASVIAKEDLDLFDGDIDAYREFMGIEPKEDRGLSDASKAQIVERDFLQAQMEQLGLGDLGSMTAAEAEKKIAAEEDRREKAAAAAAAKAAAARAAEANRTSYTSDSYGTYGSGGGYSYNTGDSFGGFASSASRSSSALDSGTGSGVSSNGGNASAGYSYGGWAKGGLVSPKAKEEINKEKKRKRKTKL